MHALATVLRDPGLEISDLNAVLMRYACACALKRGVLASLSTLLGVHHKGSSAHPLN